MIKDNLEDMLKYWETHKPEDYKFIAVQDLEILEFMCQNHEKIKHLKDYLSEELSRL